MKPATIKAIIKRPGEFGRVISVQDHYTAFCLTLGTEESFEAAVGEIVVNDMTFLFLKESQAPEIRPCLAPAFYHGFQTQVYYEGKMMQVNDLRGTVLIVGSHDPDDDTMIYQDAPSRLLRHALDIV